MVNGYNKIGYLISDTKVLKIISLYEILKSQKIQNERKKKMDKWTKLYKQIENEYLACKKLQKQKEEEGRKELAHYWANTCGNYQYFMVLMDIIQHEEEEGN